MPTLPTARDLPDPLTEREQWVCWRRQERGDKPTKVPLNPETSQFASTTDPTTWSDLATARATAEGASADGIGFVFTDADPFVGVDLDDCRDPDSGELTDAAEATVAELDSYTEVSPSGTGVHIIVEGTLPEGGRNRRDWVECYETNRYFTVTGAHVADTPTEIKPRQDALETIHEQHVQPQPHSAATGGASTPDAETAASSADTQPADPALSDEELLERATAAANGEKFRRLWRGDTSGYESHSEADMALCALLAFWTDRDATRIDRLFRDSGLMRPKWDEQHYADGATYGERTIERVLASTEETYDPAADTSGEQPLTMETAAEPNSNEHQDGPTRQPTATGRDRAELLALIDDLQTQVERLEAENERLRDRLDARADAHDDNTDADHGRLSRLLSWSR